MAHSSGIKVDGYSFCVEYDPYPLEIITKVYFSGGAVDILPIMRAPVIMKLRKHLFPKEPNLEDRLQKIEQRLDCLIGGRRCSNED